MNSNLVSSLFFIFNRKCFFRNEKQLQESWTRFWIERVSWFDGFGWRHSFGQQTLVRLKGRLKGRPLNDWSRNLRDFSWKRIFSFSPTFSARALEQDHYLDSIPSISDLGIFVGNQKYCYPTPASSLSSLVVFWSGGLFANVLFLLLYNNNIQCIFNRTDRQGAKNCSPLFLWLFLLFTGFIARCAGIVRRRDK